MNIPSNCDVVVIGGGPGGSLSATYLAQKGYDVVLLEKQQHPRYMVGESLLPDFWKYTDAAGCTDKIIRADFVRKDGGTVVWDGQISGVAFKNFGYTRPALHVERDRFDFILLENAKEKGVKVFEEVGVTHVNFADTNQPVVLYRSDQEVSGSISCRYVVDASGQSAVLGRQLGLRTVDEGFRFMSVWGYFMDSKYVSYGGKVQPFSSLDKIPPTTFVTSLDQIGGYGWSWHIPQRESTSIGLIIPSQNLKALKADDEDWDAYFERTCRAIPILGDLVKDAQLVPNSVRLIRNYSYQSSRMTGPGYFLVGDAAGFVDPIFSVGVLVAMFSAFASAWAIDQCLRKPESKAKFQSMYQSQMQGRIELARALALPHYQGDTPPSEETKALMRFQSNDSLDLMMAVSGLTARSENFKALTGNQSTQEFSPEKLLRIEEIDFSY